ncbi:hypothetical protein BT93_F3089 [Corymbia citriodora subsp. variegata]|nr:hypothetical protein BT93_F3089 [Corymbia citriodora subsp. variegata]
MCNLDVMIGLARSAMSRIGSHLAVGRQDACRLMAGELRCIRRIYDHKGADVVDLLREDPVRTLPLVLRRLQQKQDEWMAYRLNARKVWKKVFAEHHEPSLGRGDTSTIAVEALGDAGGTSGPPVEAKVEARENIGMNVRSNLFSRSQCKPTRLVTGRFRKPTISKNFSC